MTSVIPVSQKIRDRILKSNARYFANDNISAFIEPGELEELVEEIAGHYEKVIDSLVIDKENDPNSKDTHRRVAKMFINEVYKGRYHEKPKVTSFPNQNNLDQIYTTVVDVKSACSHHHVPIHGKAFIGVLAGNHVVGLSKFNRIAEWVMRRPQIQEESTVQLADEIEELAKPRGLGVVVQAKHMCVSWRGIQDTSTIMTTSVMRGSFRDDPSVKNEFLSFVRNNNFSDI